MGTTIMRIALSGIVLTWAWLGVVDGVLAQGVNGDTATVATRPDRSQATGVTSTGVRTALTNRPEEERALQEVAAAFARAYGAGDARSLASLFTDDAELIDENGGRLNGRPAIEGVFGSTFRQRPGATFAFSPTSIRFLGPDAAQEEGRTNVTIGDEPPLMHRYVALYVKQAGRWRISSLHEERDPAITPHQRLQELAWLVGDWIDESPDSVVHANCRWTDDGHFLLRDFTVRVQGKSVMTVNERIGWDPSVRQIRSWVFDSEGGHGTGLWSRAGNQWVIKSTGVMPDGRIASATHTLTRLSPHSARWTSIERTVGDRIVPDHAEYMMVRQTPQAGDR
jgi:uncharacterized protein (TIGR02246 family)